MTRKFALSCALSCACLFLSPPSSADDELSLAEDDDVPVVESSGYKSAEESQTESLERMLKRPKIKPSEKARAQIELLKRYPEDRRFAYACELRDDPATPKKSRLAALETIVDLANVRFGIWGTLWYRKYCENWPDDKLARYEAACFDAWKRLCEARPNDAGYASGRARAHLYRYTRDGRKEDLAEARAGYDRAVALAEKTVKPSEDNYNFCGLLWGQLNCIYAEGDDEKTRAALKAFQARKLKENWGRGRRGYSGLVSAARIFLEGRELDSLKLPFDTGAKAFPVPQEARYEDAFASVPAAKIVANGLSADDPRLRLLRVKWGRYGIAFRDDAPFAVRVTVDGGTKAFVDLRDPVAFARVKAAKRWNPKRADGKEREDKSPDEFRDYMENEAYVLAVTDAGAEITAKTKQGALWGIVSLIQMTDRSRKAVRKASIRDWPDVEKRGYLGSWWAPTLEYTLFQKMNSVDHQRHPCFENTFSPLAWYLEKEMGRQFHDFGLELFYGMCWTTHAPQIPMAYPRTLPYRVSVYKKYAAAHVGVYYPLDDIRFPVEKPDLEAFGSAAAIDGKHQSAIFREVVKEYPDWRFVVCAPFYWGPDGRSGFYPEQRDPYLAQWRKDLDPGIEVYWTGPRVKSYRYHPYHNEWALKAYGRRPYLFQNGMGWHNLLGYTVDEMDWPSVYCKGTLDKVLKAYHVNAHTPTDCAKIATLGDALWNVGAYNARESVTRGVGQLMGLDAVEALREGIDDLGWFDRFKYGDPGPDIGSENLEDLQRRVDRIDAAWKKACECVKKAGSQMYGHYGQGVGYAHRVLSARKSVPSRDKMFRRQVAETRGAAEVETRFRADEGDAFFSPVDFTGGRLHVFFKSDPDTEERAKERGRLTVSLCGRQTKAESKTVTARFAAESFPAMSDYLLCLCANDKGKSKLRIKVNGTVIFEGEKAFGHPRFRMHQFKIPQGALKRENVLSIENLGPGVDDWEVTGTGMHYGRAFRISYAVVVCADKLRSAVEVDGDDLVL